MTNYTDTFNRAITRTLANEGGYINDPKDPGGETFYGISKRSYPDVDIKNLTKEQATEIYYKDFWSKYPYEQITYTDLAIKLFDSCVNLGRSKGIRLMQRCLKVNGYPQVVDDGGFGPGTLATINKINGPKLLSAYRGAQARYYRAIVAAKPTEAKFLNGWLSRAAQ